jgi:hypothetical protein
MEIWGSPQLIDMVTIYHLITNKIDSKNKLPPKKTIQSVIFLKSHYFIILTSQLIMDVKTTIIKFRFEPSSSNFHMYKYIFL